MHLKHYKLPFLFTTIFPLFIMAQNEVCFEIESNPNPLDPALNSFSKYVNVLDCFHIYAESSISDAKVLHAAAVAAELLDNNEDGIVDDPLLEAELYSAEAMMPLFFSEWSPAMDDVWDYYDGCVSAALFNNEIDPSQPGHWAVKIPSSRSHRLPKLLLPEGVFRLLVPLRQISTISGNVFP